MDMLDKKGEIDDLCIQEREEQIAMHDRLKRLLRDKEIKWRQRAKKKDLKEGDRNTMFFPSKPVEGGAE
jgi:hypothetical protein